MNKFKIGDKVKVIRTGVVVTIRDIDDDDFSSEGYSINCYRAQTGGGVYWFSVHDLELIPEILTQKEKEYLSAVIKPFRDRRCNVLKKTCGKGEEYICIIVANEIINLPNFAQGSMYKGMTIDEVYGMNELGI